MLATAPLWQEKNKYSYQKCVIHNIQANNEQIVVYVWLLDQLQRNKKGVNNDIKRCTVRLY